MLEDLWNSFPNYLLIDMERLSRLFYKNCGSWLTVKRVILNPTFTLSRAVGGADGDVILGNTYLDLKATKRKPSAGDLFQILAYPLLDLNNAHDIKRVGMYLVRHGVTISWGLEELFRKMQKRKMRFQTFRREFHRVVTQTE